MLTTNQIRQKFLDFFKSKNHTIIASDSLVPKDDPTVLFTTAGMQQFKRQFLGHIDGFTRAATSQKCLRTDDLDKIGKTPCHHTFFEMLGNFSFGDYFKKDAIAWAWEFLTKHMHLSADKLWVSVYEEDAEAYNEWVNIGFPKEKIIKLGDKDNFWPPEAKQKGPNGPCGPCSEIFFDYGVNPDCKNKNCDPSCSCGRFTEVWNLVFTQYNRKEGGVLEPLPGKNIDTGMGLERLAAVVQGKKNNYETDLFEPILKDIKHAFLKISETDVRIVADHLRAVVFGISDGVMPSNEGRGYIMRKLIVNMTNIFIQSGVDRPLAYTFVDVVVKVMGEAYPKLIQDLATIKDVIKRTEESVIKLTKEKVPELKAQIRSIYSTGSRETNNKEMGTFIFFMKDTQGLPLNTIKLVLLDEGITEKDLEEIFSVYDQLMREQQVRSRAHSKMTGDRFADIDLNLAGIPKTTFIGYEHMQGSGKVIKIFAEDKDVSEVSKGNFVKIILDQTPFYAEAGGQVGDTGLITGAKGKIQIKDTQKLDDVYIHSGVVLEGVVSKDETVTAQIDIERRKAIMSNHTATHLLQAALRKILGSHVQQQGSLVDENRLRFDFTQPKPITAEEVSSIENQVNEIVGQKIGVVVEKLKLEEAKKKGALAFFAEKYGQEVRVVTVGDVSKEFCGGTHIKNTSEIELFKIVSQGSVAQGIRRLEAKTGHGARAYLKEKEKESVERESLGKQREVQIAAEKNRVSQIINSIPNDLKSSPVVNGITVLAKKFDDIEDVNNLKKIADYAKQTVPVSLVVGVGTQSTIVIAVTDDLVKKGVNANTIVKEIATLINGSGGGRPQLAQVGSKEPEKIDQMIKQMPEFIKEKVKI
jgi:alanyl-tRNA synthetase